MIRIAGLTINLLNRTIHAEGKPLELTPKEFDLMALLARNPERVYSREALLEQVWDMDFAAAYGRYSRPAIAQEAGKPA